MSEEGKMFNTFSEALREALDRLEKAGVYVDDPAVVIVVWHNDKAFTVITPNYVINYLDGYVIIRRSSNFREELAR